MNTHSFPAKLLLFGEYTVLCGSRALAIPLRIWQGKLRTRGAVPDRHLLELHGFLEQRGLFTADGRDSLHAAIAEGLHFVSDIPQGYGVGSSGALCAAIYNQFFAGQEKLSDIRTQREMLAAMESYFHGQSSGLDPLVSLMNAPVLRESGTYHLLPELRSPSGLHIFLIDSGLERTTDPLVQSFLQWSQSEDAKISCLRPLIQSVDHAISFFIDHQLATFWEHVKLISQLQFQYFSEMIPEVMVPHWEKTLQQKNIAIKLCGAGGGGFFLGFALSTDAIQTFQNSCDLRLITILSN